MLVLGLRALALHGGEAHAHLGEPRDHVLALFLEKAHVGVHAPEEVLHPAALLAQVANEDALLLKQRLVLLQVVVLLVQAVLGELDGGVCLLAALGEAPVARLELPEVVHRERGVELGEPPLQVVRALCLVHLTLERLELAIDLALDVLGPGKVLLHALELSLRALLAAAMLADARRLLDELASLLWPAREDAVELTLTDD